MIRCLVNYRAMRAHKTHDNTSDYCAPHSKRPVKRCRRSVSWLYCQLAKNIQLTASANNNNNPRRPNNVSLTLPLLLLLFGGGASTPIYCCHHTITMNGGDLWSPLSFNDQFSATIPIQLGPKQPCHLAIPDLSQCELV